MTLHAHVARRAGGSRSADRAFVTGHAAIALDGATAYEPVDVDPGTYAATLGEAIADRLDHEPSADLRAVVSAAIAHTAARLDLTPGRSPSSTVSILRVRDHVADLYVLGDSPIHYGTDHSAAVLTDDRLAAVAPAQRHRYVSDLRAGHGYSDHHRATLVELQRVQRDARNEPTGYWIAEADPDAGHHGITRTLPAAAITWAVLATDGAADIIDRVGPHWAEIAQADDDELTALLDRLHEWEATTDPDGRSLPRAKRHDDKTVIAIGSLW